MSLGVGSLPRMLQLCSNVKDKGHQSKDRVCVLGDGKAAVTVTAFFLSHCSFVLQDMMSMVHVS